MKLDLHQTIFDLFHLSRELQDFFAVLIQNRDIIYLFLQKLIFHDPISIEDTVLNFADKKTNNILLPKCEIDFDNVPNLHFAACGTAYHACMIAKYWFEQFAKISVKNHHHSTMNPKARYQIETPLDEVMNAEMISYPNTKLMCSVNVDGAAAAVLVSEKKAKELGMSRAVRVKASVLTSDPYQERDLVMPDVNSCTRKAAKEAYEMAGLGAEDIDLVELHDCFATAEMLHYENLGLCEDGEA